MKLTQKQIDAIHKEYIPYSREYGAPALAAKYKVSITHIHNIISNKVRRIYRPD